MKTVYTLKSATTIAGVYKYRPLLGVERTEAADPKREASGGGDPKYGPDQWHITTAPPCPVCFISDKDPGPDIAVGMPAELILRVEREVPEEPPIKLVK